MSSSQWGCTSCTFATRCPGRGVPRKPNPEPALSGPIGRALCSTVRAPEQVTLPEYPVTHQPWSHSSALSVESWGLRAVPFLQLLRAWASGPVKSQSGRQPWLPARPRRLYLEQDNSLQTQSQDPPCSTEGITHFFTCLFIHLFLHSFIHSTNIY